MRTHRLAAPAALLALLFGASACDDAATRVTLPAADAPPAEVARAYVQALDREDTAALRGLSTAHFAERAIGWLDNLEGVRLLQAERVIHDAGGLGSSRRHPHVVHVLGQLDLDVDDPGRSGFSDDGRTPWGYVLVRDAPGDPWRVDDEGRI